MTRAKTQAGSGDKKKAPASTLGLHDDQDVDDAFDGIRLETPSPVGADFSAVQTVLAEAKKADSPTRRAQTKSEVIESPPRLATPVPADDLIEESIDDASFDIDLDDVAEVPVADHSRQAQAQRASAKGLPPPTRQFDTAAREVAAEQEVALIGQAAAAREEAGQRVKAAREAAGKIAPSDEDARGAQARAQARAAQVRMPNSALDQALRDSAPKLSESARALERALRDSEPKLPRADSEDFSFPHEPATFAPPPAALPRVVLGGAQPREVSVSDSQMLEVVQQPPPSLQIAVFETAPNLQSAALAIAGAGHAMAVGASGREGIVKIKRALVEGQIDAVIVGMPGGEQIIEAALAITPHAPVVIAACSGKATEAVIEANAAGADLVAIRPHDPERLATVLLAAARIVEQRHDVAAAQNNEADLLARLEAGDDDNEVGGLQPFEMFQRALELELKRVRRYQYALSVALFALDIPDPSPPGIRGILRARAGNALVHSVRDIDMATEIDQDRFLVLLPYTNLTGATEVARRIISAVDAIPPVVSAGVSYQAQLTGAIAGAKPGTQLSFGTLIRDANRALAAAQRDGAELAVQP